MVDNKTIPAGTSYVNKPNPSVKPNIAPPAIEPATKDNKPSKKHYSTSQISTAVLATALMAATIGGGVLRGKYKTLKGKTSELERALSEAKKSEAVKKTLENSLDTALSEKGVLEGKVQNLEQQLNESILSREALTKQNKKISDQLEVLLNSENGEEVFTAEVAALREKVAGAKLDYDVTNPHTIKRHRTEYNDLLDLPTQAGTNNRANMKVLQIPEIENGHFDITLPMTNEVKISKQKSMDFTPEYNVKTTVSSDYADSVNWDNNKIARDILQNFYDGHGQTLDGVKIKVEPLANGKFKVRIDGKTTYTQDKALLIGKSPKRNDANAAGNYGEGLKMASLKLLRDCGAEKVLIASDNWRLNYSLQKGNITDEKVLTYSIDKVSKKFDGNFIEFETCDEGLVKSIRNTINRFYHSGNEHFKCPNFENELFGIKLLNKGEKGGVYIAGQRFEFNGDYDGFKEMVIFIKEKPPMAVLDPSRDRTSLNSSDMKKIVEWLVKNNPKTTENDRLQLIKVFEPYWTSSPFGSDAAKFFDDILQAEHWNYNNPLHINFPSDCVAYSRCDDSIKETLEKNGYRICKSQFNRMGMKSIADVYGEARKHTPLTPTAVEEKRIIILKEAIKELSETMKKLGFNEKEIDTRIHIFDRTSPQERLHSKALAEAIVENNVSKGFWIDRGYLNDSPFGHVLETSLHELTHKVGGDSTAEFSYKLTDVNAGVIEDVLKNKMLRSKLQALSKLWNETV